MNLVHSPKRDPLDLTCRLGLALLVARWGHPQDVVLPALVERWISRQGIPGGLVVEDPDTFGERVTQHNKSLHPTLR
jgi:hypothetical protein